MHPISTHRSTRFPRWGHRALRATAVLIAGLLAVRAPASPPAAAPAADPAAAIANDPHAADRAKLRELKAFYERAVAAGDIDALGPHLAPGFTGVMVTSDAVSSLDQLKAYWARMQALMGEGGAYRVELVLDQPAEFLGDVAVAHGTTKDHVHTGHGRDYHFEGRWTAVLVRTPEGWKAVRIHGSMDPLTNPFVVAGLAAAGWMSGGVAAVVAGAAGAIAGWLIGRRRRARPVTTGPAT